MYFFTQGMSATPKSITMRWKSAGTRKQSQLVFPSDLNLVSKCSLLSRVEHVLG